MNDFARKRILKRSGDEHEAGGVWDIFYLTTQSFAAGALFYRGHIAAGSIVVGLVLAVGIVYLFRRPLRRRVLLWMTRGLYENLPPKIGGSK